MLRGHFGGALSRDLATDPLGFDKGNLVAVVFESARRRYADYAATYDCYVHLQATFQGRKVGQGCRRVPVALTVGFLRHRERFPGLLELLNERSWRMFPTKRGEHRREICSSI